MTAYVALLRAVNVGGTGKLPMKKLTALCEAAGFDNVRTYIASGNVVFTSRKPAAQVKVALEKELAAYAGKKVAVAVRTAKEMAAVLARNPFDGKPEKFTVAIFLDRKPARGAIGEATGRADEVIRLGRREIYVHYPHGQGRSKLKVPAAKDGTARNMNTVAALAEMAAAL